MKIFTLLLALALYGLSPSKSEVIGEFESFDIEIPYDWNIYSEDFQMEIGPTSKFRGTMLGRGNILRSW